MPARKVCSVVGCDNGKNLAKGFCQKHYIRWRKYGDPLGGRRFDGERLEFFLKQLERQTDECLIWPYSTVGRGYGVVVYQGKRHKAHRLALEMHLGRPIRPGFLVAHKPVVCHNPRCFNPRHLREATVKENSNDRLLDNTHIRGERHKLAKLTEESVRRIRNDWRSGNEIAEEYGIARGTVYAIRGRKTWAHVV